MQAAYEESHARAVADHFDASYYLAMNPDVRARGVDPISHFLSFGWREGRNPSRAFDVRYYLRTYPDIAAAGLNPLVHYALQGAREGRLPKRPLDVLRRELERASAPRLRVKDWSAAADQSNTLDRLALGRSLASAMNVRDGLVVSVSHDDYERNLGGVQNVIRDERRAFERRNWIYLHLSPATPMPMLAEPALSDDFRFGIRLGSDWLGQASASDLRNSLADLRDNDKPVLLIIHHLMGHAPEALLELTKATRALTIFWVHDLFTLCQNYTLLRNDVRFCNAPPVSSGACRVCAYGDDRPNHLVRVQEFFDLVVPLVLAPSEAALDLWRSQGHLRHREAHVQPIARLVLAPEPVESAHTDPNRSIRVAHLGMRTVHKGWPVFEELALRFAKDARYSFYQLGISNGDPPAGCIRNVNVQVSRQNPDLMVEKIAENRIDVVISWSLWPETFCFAVHEALAGGAFVLARADAGNVAHALTRNAPEQGRVLSDEKMLFDLFDKNQVRDLLDSAHRRRGVLIPESGSVTWLGRFSETLRSGLFEKPPSKSRAAELAITDV